MTILIISVCEVFPVRVVCIFSAESVSTGVIRNPVYVDVCICTGNEEKFVMRYRSLAFEMVIVFDGIRRLPM